MISEIAPAKINLYLHVGGVRADGLHELASLFVFAEDGDVVSAAPSDELSLQVTGPFASALDAFPVDTNLVFRAAAQLRDACGVRVGAALTLDKHLPIAAGIGGGSADAAAAYRSLIRLWDLDISKERLNDLAFELGADIPACLGRAPVNVTAAGEQLAAGPALPPLWVCLANPRTPMPTGPIFSAFDKKFPTRGAPAMAPLNGADPEQLVRLLGEARNDLEPFAIERAPVIGDVLEVLAAQPAALMSRMSGSGATCFALFPTAEAAFAAAGEIDSRGWWSMASRIISR